MCFIKWRNKVGHSCSVIKFHTIVCICLRQLPKGQSTKLKARIMGIKYSRYIKGFKVLPQRTTKEESWMILNCFKFQTFFGREISNFLKTLKLLKVFPPRSSSSPSRRTRNFSLSHRVPLFQIKRRIDRQPTLAQRPFQASFYRDSIRRIHQGMAIPRVCES